MYPLLGSKQITLRKTVSEDIEYVVSTESSPDNMPFIILWEKEKHEETLLNHNLAHLIIEDKHTVKPVGYIILSGIQNQNNSIELMRITVSEKGNGFGRQAIELIKELAFYHLNANRLWLDVKTTNTRAMQLYESTGFTHEGTLRECLKNGKSYESLHIMSILRSEWLR